MSAVGDLVLRLGKLVSAGLTAWTERLTQSAMTATAVSPWRLRSWRNVLPGSCLLAFCLPEVTVLDAWDVEVVLEIPLDPALLDVFGFADLPTGLLDLTRVFCK